tara:strand:+ start:436 stop:615 length:180 start_codon:yes stop_codon:yes gene_type:complete
MKTFQTFPSEKNFENWEVFNHDIYLKNMKLKKKKLDKLRVQQDIILKKIKNFLGWKIIF